VRVLDLERHATLVFLVYDHVRADRTARCALCHLDLGAHRGTRKKRDLSTLAAAPESRRDNPVYVLLDVALRQNVDV
jgi:hypothetical protein